MRMVLLLERDIIGCQVLHDKLGIPASARASLGVYNTKEDFDKLNEAINKCKNIFNTK